jgi:phosphoglucosamine mutase
MTRWFGTDGIRGMAGEEPLVPSFLVRLGQALGTRWSGAEQPVFLGHDGRISADMLKGALATGLTSVGCDVAHLGLVSTPALSWLTDRSSVAGGLMISASHNEFSDNGVKCFQETGEKFTPEQEEDVESHLRQEAFELAKGASLGRFLDRGGELDRYVEAFEEQGTYQGHVVVDCANGGTSEIARRVLQDRVRSLTLINHQPDGTNINENAGSLHPESLSETVRREDADVGFALDGDGDRLIAVDEEGAIVNGDVLMLMLAETFCHDDGGMVMTVMSNLGLRKALEERGVNYEVVGVGDRNVYRRMVDRGWRIGGEQSGHIIDREWLPTGDGLRTITSVLDVLDRSGRSLAGWNDEIEVYPQVLHNIEVNQKPPLDDLSETTDEITRVENELGESGRVLVRYSGTEPVARIMLEGPDEDQLNEWAESIGRTMEREINQLEVS